MVQPLVNRAGFWRRRKKPTESRRLLETTDKFCYYPPPIESRRLGTAHERGRPLRKILDLRLYITRAAGVANKCLFFQRALPHPPPASSVTATIVFTDRLRKSVQRDV